MTPTRTALAAVLTAAALGLPCAAWYVSGSRAMREEAGRLERVPLDRARDEAGVLAARLAQRLESLRHSESRRAHTDYLLAGPEGCELPAESPLAHGPADPLVWTHFQIDEVGELTLPSLVLGAETGAEEQWVNDARALDRAMRHQLHGTAPSVAWGVPGVRTVQIQGAEKNWVVTVGPLRWQTVAVAAEPVLAAVRHVATPDGALVQGFVLRAPQMDEIVAGGAFPARVLPGRPAATAEAAVGIEADWKVQLDPGAAVDEARAAALGVRRRFLRLFAAGLVATILGGGLVVGIVWHADRLAAQRARFAAAAAHELRTPLASMRLYGEMLAEGTGNPDSERAYARTIAGEAERLGRVVFNLLGFSRLERGELRVRPVEADLAQAVRGIVDQLRPALESRGAHVRLTLKEDLPRASFDRDALHQMLQNLLDNAAKHGKSEGDPIEVVLEPRQGGSLLSVSDRGPGLAPSVRRRLFRPFTRDTANEGSSAGLGLGLALVAALARAQRATAGYEPGPAGGSTFWLMFPAWPARREPS